MQAVLTILLGAGIGALLGTIGKCSSGTCPLTSTWWRGALYGAAVGGLIFLTSGRTGSAALNESTQNIKRITTGEFAAEVEQATVPVVVDFYATWCGPCKTLAPQLETMAAAYSGRVKFVKVNVDESADLARRFEVEGVPTLLFFNGGKVVDKLAGVPGKGRLQERLDRLAAS